MGWGGGDLGPGVQRCGLGIGLWGLVWSGLGLRLGPGFGHCLERVELEPQCLKVSVGYQLGQLLEVWQECSVCVWPV